MQHLVLSQDRACAQLFKADLRRHDLLQGRKGAEGSPWGLLCRTHCNWNLWELCFECIEIFIYGLLVSWQRYLRLIDRFDICLCVLCNPSRGFTLVRGFLVFPRLGIWTRGDWCLKERHATFLQPPYAGKKTNTSHCTENITVGCRNTLFSLPLPSTLNVMLSTSRTPNFSAVAMNYFVSRDHCGGQN